MGPSWPPSHHCRPEQPDEPRDLGRGDVSPRSATGPKVGRERSVRRSPRLWEKGARSVWGETHACSS